MPALLPQDQLRWPIMFTGGMLVRYEPCQGSGVAYVGGPLEQRFVGRKFGDEPLHRVFSFTPGVLPQPSGHYLQGRLGFFYGLRYDGCHLRYLVPVQLGVNAQFVQESDPIKVLTIQPKSSSSDWPYDDYPRLLPYVPLKEVSRKPIDAQTFAATYSWQGIDDLSENELVVVVPTMPNLGISLWGRRGEDAAVQIIFRFNYLTNEVSVITQCA